MADSGDNDMTGAAHHLGIFGHLNLAAEILEGLPHRGKIAGVIVDEGDHNKPLVLGSIFASCLSRAAGHSQCAGEGLEKSFDLVVIGAAVHRFQVNVGAGAASESFEEVVDKLGLQIAHQTRANFGVDDAGCAPAEVDGGDAERFVHRHEEVAGAIDALLVAERVIEGLAEGNADIFDGVVLVNVEVALAAQLEIEAAVTCEELEHVIEEADASRDLVLAGALDGERQVDLGLGSVAS